MVLVMSSMLIILFIWVISFKEKGKGEENFNGKMEKSMMVNGKEI